jgi:large subunit ribosomal protein L25
VKFLNEAISPGLKRGGTLNVVRSKVEVVVDPDHIPEHFDIDLAVLDINDSVHFHDLKGTENTKPALSGDFVVATITPPLVTAEQLAAEAAAAAAAVAAKGAKGKGAPKKK